MLGFLCRKFPSVFPLAVTYTRTVSRSSHRSFSIIANRRYSKMDKSWSPPPPCRVSDLVCDIDTPALIVDMDKLERNLKILPDHMNKYPGVDVRPHVKAHKCPQLAALQVEHGAVGVCCQTLVEAEAMVYGAGISDVFVSNQLIGKTKLKRFVKLAEYSKLSICVDDGSNIRDLSEAAAEAAVNIDCVVEVNVGQDRCGVEPGPAAMELAKLILQSSNLTFKGIQSYQGWNQHVRSIPDRKKAVDLVVQKTKHTLQAFEEAGISCPYVTGGGTGTYPFEASSGVFTEVQPGSYVFMDVDYGKNLDESGNFTKDFEQSQYVLATIQSVTGTERAVVDAGLKALSMDSGVPQVNGSDVVYHIGGDEHGILRPGTGFKVGDLVWLIPGHCDPTVNMYDWLIGIRGEKVENMWRILGRGPGV